MYVRTLKLTLSYEVYKVYKAYLKEAGGFWWTTVNEDDHSHWAPPYWNIMKETFSLGRTQI